MGPGAGPPQPASFTENAQLAALDPNSQLTSDPQPITRVSRSSAKPKPSVEACRRRCSSRPDRQPEPQFPNVEAPTQPGPSVCFALPTETSFCFLSATQPSRKVVENGGLSSRTDKRHLQKTALFISEPASFSDRVEGGVVSSAREHETPGGFGVSSYAGQSLRGRVNAPGRTSWFHDARGISPQRGPREWLES